MQKTVIYTDGSSRGNPGPGGFGALLVTSDEKQNRKVTELGGHEDHTTNNRMELLATLESLQYIEERKIQGSVEIHTDSAYVLNGITGWVFGWEKNGWKTQNGDDVLNQDLWKVLSAVAFRTKSRQGLEWIKVKGHSGIWANERVDQIATEYADSARPLLYTGALESYLKLMNIEEKELFAVTYVASTTKSSSKNKKPYAYVSCVDGSVYKDETWAACEKRVKGKKGAKFKKVFSKEEYDELVTLWRGHEVV
jgi:ribonuclease HI